MYCCVLFSIAMHIQAFMVCIRSIHNAELNVAEYGVCVCVCLYVSVCLIDYISSKIVPLEKGVVIYGAKALSPLPVALFVLPINVRV